MKKTEGNCFGSITLCMYAHKCVGICTMCMFVCALVTSHGQGLLSCLLHFFLETWFSTVLQWFLNTFVTRNFLLWLLRLKWVFLLQYITKLEITTLTTAHFRSPVTLFLSQLMAWRSILLQQPEKDRHFQLLCIYRKDNRSHEIII